MIQLASRDHLPYLILIVELDTQRGRPGHDDALRIARNLATPAGDLAPSELLQGQRAPGLPTVVSVLERRDRLSGAGAPVRAVARVASRALERRLNRVRGTSGHRHTTDSRQDLLTCQRRTKRCASPEAFRPHTPA